jgi:hypothetical protein
MTSVVANFGAAHVAHAGGNFSACPPLNHIQAATLASQSKTDVTAHLYSGILTLADALNGLRASYYSWATTKLYYSLFYALRASLLVRGYGLFYYNTKPGLIEIKPGGLVRKLTTGEAQGGSHGSTLRLYAKFVPSSVLLSPVGADPSLQWLKDLREEVNYNQIKFMEPGCPRWFANSLAKNPLRKVVGAYITDNVLYAFDPDHAAMALPMLSLRLATQEAEAAGCTLEDSERQFLTGSLRDDAGPLANLAKYLSLSV